MRFQGEQQLHEAAAKADHGMLKVPRSMALGQALDEVREAAIPVQPHDDPLAPDLLGQLLFQ